MITPFHSIRWRLQAWHGLILLLVIVAFCVTAYRLALDTQTRRIDSELAHLERSFFRSLMISAQTATAKNAQHRDTPPPPPGLIAELLRKGLLSLPPSEASQFKGTEPGYAFFSLQDVNGKILLKSSNAPDDINLQPGPESDPNEDSRTVDERRELVRSSFGMRSMIGRDISPEMEEMHHFAWSLAACGSAVWLLGLLGGWWLAGRVIRPIDAISRAATRIAEGNLDERIDATKTDNELDQLCLILDKTFERLRAAIEQQKQFTADASHELRTPVTILLSETQRILKRPRTPEEYKEAIETCQQAALRMKRLIESLLLLTRQESHGEQATKGVCDLAVCLHETIKQQESLAAAKGIRIDADLEPSSCQADSAALSILAGNLIGNAIQYNRAGGRINVSCRAEPEHVVLVVSDDGPGIPAEDLPHIFERFYRVDKARTAQDLHAGLGLAIVRSIVDNHEGSIEVKSSPGKGTCFTVILPVKPPLPIAPSASSAQSGSVSSS
jgi:heavy metal sensor kinase